MSSDNTAESNSHIILGLVFQAWTGVAVWMTFGLLLEGLIGYRIASYLVEDVRREMLRLAHAHGTLLNLTLLGVAFTLNKINKNAPLAAIWALRIGAVTMPLGFLIAGIWHFKGEPGLGIWLVPPSALLVIFGAITMAFVSFKK